MVYHSAACDSCIAGFSRWQADCRMAEVRDGGEWMGGAGLGVAYKWLEGRVWGDCRTICLASTSRRLILILLLDH